MMNPQRRRRGFSLIELLIVVAIIMIIIGIAAPKYKQALTLSQQTAAIAAIRTLCSRVVLLDGGRVACSGQPETVISAYISACSSRATKPSSSRSATPAS